MREVCIAMSCIERAFRGGIIWILCMRWMAFNCVDRLEHDTPVFESSYGVLATKWIKGQGFPFQFLYWFVCFSL